MNAKKGRMSKGFRLFSIAVALSMLCALFLLAGAAAADEGAPAAGPEGVDCYWGGVKFKDLDADGVNQEAGEPLLSGWTINLIKEGTTAPVYTAVTQSDPLGKWQFPDSLPTGQIYLVSEVLKSGWKQTYPNTNGGVYRIQYNGAGSYVLKSPVPTGYVAGSLNFGNAPLGSIGDYVWNDADYGKDQDASEAGIGNIEVRLLRVNSNGTTTLLATKTTLAAATTTPPHPVGWYLFTDLEAGNYMVDVDEADSDMPSSSGGRWQLTTANNPMAVTLGVGQNYLNADFGFAGVLANEVAVGDYVWYDKADYTVQDFNTGNPTTEERPDSGGLQCITVSLLDSLGSVVGQKNTTSFGEYHFLRLKPGTYSMKVDQSDEDLSQLNLWDTPPATRPATRPCHLVTEWISPSVLASTTVQAMSPLAMSPEGATTPGAVGPYVVPPGTANLTYDFGFNLSPTAVSIQAFGATPLPLASVEVALAAAGALVAGALALKRRR